MTKNKIYHTLGFFFKYSILTLSIGCLFQKKLQYYNFDMLYKWNDKAFKKY